MKSFNELQNELKDALKERNYEKAMQILKYSKKYYPKNKVRTIYIPHAYPTALFLRITSPKLKHI